MSKLFFHGRARGVKTDGPRRGPSGYALRATCRGRVIRTSASAGIAQYAVGFEASIRTAGIAPCLEHSGRIASLKARPGGIRSLLPWEGATSVSPRQETLRS